MSSAIQPAPTSIVTASIKAADLPGFASEGPILVEVDTWEQAGRMYRRSYLVETTVERQQDDAPRDREIRVTFAESGIDAITFAPADDVVVLRPFLVKHH
ncbi:hypothetical protein ACFWDA_13585 [Rhodococcus zopfii]|uniref:Uncharacterized protein n=1 Tax=Rhodococcus zopfii TaxID=43772 RepID=A0ABU3WQ34_9NOCA|nr:hypothetical protein [Rhodococcus zopfii]MDV2476110.1 hypothetical protein [Rhodococcus zopfii]